MEGDVQTDLHNCMLLHNNFLCLDRPNCKCLRLDHNVEVCSARWLLAELTLQEYNLMVTCLNASSKQRRQLSVSRQLTGHCSLFSGSCRFL